MSQDMWADRYYLISCSLPPNAVGKVFFKKWASGMSLVPIFASSAVGAAAILVSHLLENDDCLRLQVLLVAEVGLSPHGPQIPPNCACDGRQRDTTASAGMAIREIHSNAGDAETVGDAVDAAGLDQLSPSRCLRPESRHPTVKMGLVCPMPRHKLHRTEMPGDT